MMAGGPQQQQRHKNFQKTRQQTENRQKKNKKEKEWKTQRVVGVEKGGRACSDFKKFRRKL